MSNVTRVHFSLLFLCSILLSAGCQQDQQIVDGGADVVTRTEATASDSTGQPSVAVSGSSSGETKTLSEQLLELKSKNSSVADPGKNIPDISAPSVSESFAPNSPAASSPNTKTASTPATKSMKPMGKMGGMPGMSTMTPPEPGDIDFKDEVETNVEAPDGLDELVFTDTDGERVALKDFLGKKNVVLVFTEGFSGMLCPFCTTQTSRLVANYPKFTELDTEVLVVYPGTRDHLGEFIKAALTVEKKDVEAVPFPIVLDQDFKATDFFSIRSMHAHPSTYVIDKQGKICLAYVGADMSADRPSVKAILAKLKNVNGG
jgi:peroxiredoxin